MRNNLKIALLLEKLLQCKVVYRKWLDNAKWWSSIGRGLLPTGASPPSSLARPTGAAATTTEYLIQPTLCEVVKPLCGRVSVTHRYIASTHRCLCVRTVNLPATHGSACSTALVL